MAVRAITHNLRQVRMLVLITIGCAAPNPDGGNGAVTATLRNAAGRELGTLTLRDATGGINLSGRLRGVAPGPHGLHFHTVGRCEPTFDAAGGHWNPTTRQHGLENAQGAHLGDLQNITAGADSSATINVTSRGGTLRGANPLLDADGASVVLHAAADDNRTDPSGNSGARIACGAVAGG